MSSRSRGGSILKKQKISNTTTDDHDKIMHEIRQCREELKAKKIAPAEIAKAIDMSEMHIVTDMQSEEVALAIETLFVDAVESIIRGESFSFAVPSRSAGNQIYISALDQVVLKTNVAERSFVHAKQVRKTALLARVLSLVHEVIRKGIHVTKRDLFYTDVKLFVKQEDSDGVLEDAACMIGCPRNCLHVVAAEKGLVVGRLQFYEDGDLIDCTRMGITGKAIPSTVDKISDISSDAEFILLVEKDAAYNRLAEDRFYNQFPCILITGKGQPDVATRAFLHRVTSELQIPVLAFVDADPYGLKILSVYMSGSKSMSYDAASLTTPDIKWLGLRPSDLDTFDLPDQCRLPMTSKDIEMGKQLIEEAFIQKNPKWCKELNKMLQSKQKAEIQALSAFGFQFVSKVYLPTKLRRGDWI
uniref:DNA topoisomerase (ATP-hydrolyzing) n=1 Tax=Aureoumbra lagunensis TaxID=44058 RepID=A0A7S3K6B4_9STRA|mmetsp:Transcript_13840/g.20739  ORF Transcript_13840/g.20739 Transcript_13840/m.20739 type:complete len:415 (+) Transcript_13840:35-1279(+)